MKNQDPAQTSDQSTLLHLEKFAPNQPPGLSAPENPANDTITGVARQAARQTCEQSAQPVIAPKTNNALSAPSLLGVVSYCYAKDVCSSADIERKLARNPQMQSACGGDLPDRRTLRRFRRFNREAIQATLEKILRWRRKKEKASLLSAVGAAPGPGANEPGESTIVFAKQEAVARMEKAVFVDSMEEEN